MNISVAGLTLTLALASAEEACAEFWRFEAHVIAGASPEDAWWAVATEEGLAAWAAPKAVVQLEEGGAYELHWMPDNPPGQRGMEGTTVIGFIPGELLVYQGSTPPQFADLRDEAPFGVYWIHDLADGRVRLDVNYVSRGVGPRWDEFMKYQEQGWQAFADRLRGAIEAHARDRNGLAPSPAATPKVEAYGAVTLTDRRAIDGVVEWETIVPATPEDIWEAWTTVEGFRGFMAPDGRIELRRGGKYAAYHEEGMKDDVDGPNGNYVLAFVPGKMVSIHASAPKEFPTVRREGSQAFILIEPIDALRTRVRVVGAGWGLGGEWDEVFSFFKGANTWVLDQHRKRFIHGPFNWETQSFPDEDLTERRLSWTVEIKAPADEVWSAWASKEGAETFFAPHCEIELRSGGAYDIHFFPDNPPGARGAEGQRVRAWIPDRMIAFDWGVPPEFSELRERFMAHEGGRPFVVVECEPINARRSRCTLTMQGFGGGAAWDGVMEYFSAAWPKVLGWLQQRFEDGPVDWSKGR